MTINKGFGLDAVINQALLHHRQQVTALSKNSDIRDTKVILDIKLLISMGVPDGAPWSSLAPPDQKRRR